MKIFLTVCFIAIPLLLLLLILMRIIYKKLSESMNDLVAVQFNPENILIQEPAANFFGQESKGMGQVRGNGSLILTHESLHFILFMPRRSWEISLDKITGISTPKSHLGKTKIKPLLRVDYHGEEGPDAIAWLVADLEAWKQTLERAITDGAAKNTDEHPCTEG